MGAKHEVDGTCLAEPLPAPAGTEDEEIRRALVEKVTVPLWPTAGRALGLGRNATYEAAARGDLPVLRIGGRILVPTAKLAGCLASARRKPRDRWPQREKAEALGGGLDLRNASAAGLTLPI